MGKFNIKCKWEGEAPAEPRRLYQTVIIVYTSGAARVEPRPPKHF